MSSTKIINVLKDDSFQEILDLFKATPAEEVIFVLPKRSKAFNKEDHFLALKAEAKQQGKSVSFLCSNPELNEIAKKHHFDVLLARSPVPRKKSNAINVVNQIEDFYSEPAHDPDEVSISSKDEDIEEEDDLAEEMVPVTVASRPIKDVIAPDEEAQHSVKVTGKAEKEMPVQIRSNDDEEDSEEMEETAAPVLTAAREPKIAQASWSSWLKSEGGAPKSELKPKIKSSRSGSRRGLVALACVAVVILGTVVFISTGKAQVTIKPAATPLDIKLDVVASDNIPAVDPVSMSIPGQVFNIQKSVSKDYQATGHVDVAQKARGTITVYNELTSNQPLIATTRFQSSDQHIFHTLTSITVPAAKTGANGKLIPGSVDVQVIADKPGPDYNVGVGLFTVPAFKEKGDTDKYQKVYGQSSTPMTGGANGQSAVATDQDLASAKQDLTTQLTSSIQDELKSQINDLKVINASSVSIGEPTASTPSSNSTFTANLSGSLKTVGFKESDLKSLIAQYVDNHNNMQVVPDKLTLAYDNIRWDDQKKGLVFTVHVTGSQYAKIDTSTIISSLLGKNDTQIKAYLGGISGISEAHVSLSPFWVRSVPKNQDRVHVDLSY